MSLSQRIAKLAEIAPQLGGSQSFAESLCTQYRRGRSLSWKQEQWVDKLIERAANPPAPIVRETVEVGDMSGAIALFDKAAQHLRRPKVRLRVFDSTAPVHRDILLSVAGARAKVPGSINVKDDAPYGEGSWYGRIHRDGKLEKNGMVDVPQALVDLLKRFAEQPAATAAEFGRLTGRCCFCNRPLEDERSTAVGYGGTCAKNYGLPWGRR